MDKHAPYTSMGSIFRRLCCLGICLFSLKLLVQAQPWTTCGCSTCAQDIWNADANGYSCGARILWLMEAQGYSSSRACRTIALNQFPMICGACSPDTCDRGSQNYGFSINPPLPGPPAPTKRPTIQPSSAPTPFPTSPETKCGCPSCTAQVWNTIAGGYSCLDRINFLINHMGKTEQAACQQVGSVEFANQCGLCACNTVNEQTGNEYSNPNLSNPYRPPSDSVYCFPPPANRKRYSNVWGKYAVEVKEGNCAPGNNLFRREAVSLSGNDLKLELKNIGGQWQSGEVRVLPPSNAAFDYGRYTFSLKSVRVVDLRNGQVVATNLPLSTIVGFFTWDSTENYAIHENYNHEVDVELSQWNVPGNADVQFLVQPPGSPQQYRFFSGNQGGFRQAPHVYGFEWKPAEIQWFSSAGGGQSFIYNSQAALAANQPDYTQCMPAQVEVRINLWDQFGSYSPPNGLQDYHSVEVVIDSFQFIPSGLKAVPNGGVCTKDCQCGDSGRCLRNSCAATRTSDLVQYESANNTMEMSSNETSSHDYASSTSNSFGISMSIFFPVVLSVILLGLITIVALFFYERCCCWSSAPLSDEQAMDKETVKAAVEVLDTSSEISIKSQDNSEDDAHTCQNIASLEEGSSSVEG